MKNEIPQEIASACNAMLAPYGASIYSDGCKCDKRGFTDVNGACRYLHVSRPTFYRMVKDANVKAYVVRGNEGCAKRRPKYAFSDLDAMLEEVEK